MIFAAKGTKKNTPLNVQCSMFTVIMIGSYSLFTVVELNTCMIPQVLQLVFSFYEKNQMQNFVMLLLPQLTIPSQITMSICLSIHPTSLENFVQVTYL